MLSISELKHQRKAQTQKLNMLQAKLLSGYSTVHAAYRSGNRYELQTAQMSLFQTQERVRAVKAIIREIDIRILNQSQLKLF